MQNDYVTGKINMRLNKNLAESMMIYYANIYFYDLVIRNFI